MTVAFLASRPMLYGGGRQSRFVARMPGGAHPPWLAWQVVDDRLPAEGLDPLPQLPSEGGIATGDQRQQARTRSGRGQVASGSEA